MFDLVGFLTAPHLYLGAILGFAVGLGTAWLIHWAFPASAPTSMLALIVAVGCIAGLVVGARAGSSVRK